jgi:hypothetical protein
MRKHGDDLNYDALDPGIRETVRLCRQKGFHTTDSGDGVSKPEAGRVFPFPHVVATLPCCDIVEAHRLQALLGPDWTVELTYSTKDTRTTLFASREALRHE